jgi:uncharacterized protein (DUF302 family)
MVAEPLAALDLPLKIVVWADQEMATELSYNSADYLARRTVSPTSCGRRWRRSTPSSTPSPSA